jgi:hypothetical protein
MVKSHGTCIDRLSDKSGTSEVLISKAAVRWTSITMHRQVRRLANPRADDVMLMAGGGHGFRMLEDTVFLEVKQGPDTGTDEKECF